MTLTLDENDDRQWCREGYANAGIHFGGELKLFGIGIAQETSLWTRNGEHMRVGPGCR